jgi:MFS family permease
VLLTVFGIRCVIGADALSYLVSAAANAMTSRPALAHATPEVEAPRHARRTSTVRHVARDLTEGVRVLRGQPVARALLLVTVIFLAANASLSAMLIPLGIRRLGGGENTGFVLSALGVGFLLAAPLLRALLDRVPPRILLAATLTVTAVGQFALFTSTSLVTALPAAVAIGTFGSMSEVIPQTALQRVIPNAVLGRIGAVFLTGEAAVGLLGAVGGPFLAQVIQLPGLAAAASLVTLAAAALTRLTVPRTPFRLQPKGLARANADGNAERGNHSRWSELVMIRPIMASPPPPARTRAGPGAIRRGAAQRRAA